MTSLEKRLLTDTETQELCPLCGHDEGLHLVGCFIERSGRGSAIHIDYGCELCGGLARETRRFHKGGVYLSVCRRGDWECGDGELWRD
jgi:hypothetical protein